MIKNYFVIAWRQILKNKLYAAINILGLMVGLAIYVFGNLLVDYEQSHDMHWAHSDRIFTAGSVFGPTANIGVNETEGIYTAFAKFIDAEIEEVEEIARTVGAEFLISNEDDHYYQDIKFADPALLKIFDFDYLEGDARALDDPSGVLLTRAVAEKFFGDEPALGRSLTLDHDVSLHVTAVIAAPPANSHFTSSLISDKDLGMIAPLQALNAATDYDLAGNFNNLSSGDLTYMLLEPGKDKAWLQASLDGIYERHFPERDREFVVGLKARSIIEANTYIWDAVDLPVLDSIRLLGFLVLVVAIVNYTNLATAQSLGRAREIGLRKTMGASRPQLIAQFLIEGLCIAALAMLIALALLELVTPVFNSFAGRAVALNYAQTFPGLVLTAAAVGLVAGAYPAYLITRTSPIDALRDGGGKGRKGSHFRSAMLVLQFSISIFMLAMVMVVYFQNQKMEASSHIYPKSQIITLQRLGVASIQARLGTLRNELQAIPGVESVAYSSRVPFEGSNSAFEATPQAGDDTLGFLMTQIVLDEHFMGTYDIPLLAGRGFNREISADTVREDVLTANVIVNELALERLGFHSPEAALGKVFHDIMSTRESRTYRIVGVFPNQNFQGLQNQVKPTTLFMVPQEEASRSVDAYRYGSIRVAGANLADTLEEVEAVWEKLIDDYPIQSEFLEATFEDSYQIFSGMTFALAVFALVALSLSLVGLFGLAAFMAGTRTREIGIRKVMGASLAQIVRLLVWQFSRPVLWALLLALPLSYLAADRYLTFFADRIEMPAGIVAFAGLVAVFVSWSIVAFHAIRIAQANPIRALRYE